MADTRIMIVEDEVVVARHIESGLQELGHAVCARVSSGEEAISQAVETGPDLVLMDIKLQGAGLVSAYGAASSSATGCANQGFDIDTDLDGTEHYGGPANRDEDGNCYIMDLDGYARGGSYISTADGWVEQQ